MFIRITPSVAVGNETRVLHKNGVHASYGHTDIPWDLPNSSRAPPPKERPLHLYISGLTPLSAILYCIGAVTSADGITRLHL